MKIFVFQNGGKGVYSRNIKFHCLPGSQDSGFYPGYCILLKYQSFFGSC